MHPDQNASSEPVPATDPRKPSPLPAKTNLTAVVVVPPEPVWPPIQAIRREHDRQYRRWMPHVTLLYPFRPQADFPNVVPLLAAVCAGIPAFEIELQDFRWFHHGGDHYTLWLAPLPVEPLVRVHQALLEAVPDCGDTGRFGAGFTPHLSVGQVRGRTRRQALEQALQSKWQRLRFAVRHLSLIFRAPPPDDVFRVAHEVAFKPSPDAGKSSEASARLSSG